MEKTCRAVLSCLALSTLASFLAWGCGGSSSPGAGDTRVNVSLAAARSAGGALAASALEAAAPPASELPDHAWITVTRVALLPADGGPALPDGNGEPSVFDGSSPPDGGKLVRTLPEPVEVDLLSLPSLEGALFLDAFDRVPAGTYGKLRLYYRDPKVHFPGSPDNAAVHATANYHIDLHFRQGGLVVPVSTDRDVRIVNVTVFFVLGNDGLKINVNANRILMRPQVFCTVDALSYLLRGTADNVEAAAASFDLLTPTGRSFPVLWDGNSAWRWIDDSALPPRPVAVEGAEGAASLRDTALVSVVGRFEAATGSFLADRIDVTFPALRADNVLLPFGADNAFLLGTVLDNVAVFPVPSKEGARYDELSTLAPVANGYELVRPGAFATVRGYAAPGGIDAYWISLGTF